MYLSTGDVAKKVGVSLPTINRYVQKGILKPDRILPSGKDGRKGKQFFEEETVENFIKNLG